MATLDVNGMKLRIESALWRSQYSDVYKVSKQVARVAYYYVVRVHSESFETSRRYTHAPSVAPRYSSCTC